MDREMKKVNLFRLLWVLCLILNGIFAILIVLDLISPSIFNIQFNGWVEKDFQGLTFSIFLSSTFSFLWILSKDCAARNIIIVIPMCMLASFACFAGATMPFLLFPGSYDIDFLLTSFVMFTTPLMFLVLVVINVVKAFKRKLSRSLRKSGC